jgi:Pectate lyase superfamily protein
MSRLLALLLGILSIFGTKPAPRTFWVDDYGTAGDGKTDDTAAFQKAFAACMANAACSALHLEGRTYLITNMIDLASSSATGQSKSIALLGEPGATILCQPTAAITACVRNLNGHGGELLGVYIEANANATYGFEDTATPQVLSNGVVSASCFWGSLPTGCGSEGFHVERVRVTGAQWGIGIGPDTNGDVSHVHFYDSRVGNNVQGGIVSGNGQTADVADNFAFGVTCDGNPVCVKVNGGAFSISGAGFDSNALDIQYARGTSQVEFDNIRSENAQQFLRVTDTGTGAPYGPIVVRALNWDGGTTTLPVIDVENVADPISISDSQFRSASPVSFTITGYDYWNPADLANPEPLTLNNVCTSNPAAFNAQLAAWAANPHLNFYSAGDYGCTTGIVPGSGKIWSSSHQGAL